MELTTSEKHAIYYASKRIMGSIVGLLSIQRNNLSSERVRKICGDLYIKTDEVVGLIEKAERRAKKSK